MAQATRESRRGSRAQSQSSTPVEPSTGPAANLNSSSASPVTPVGQQDSDPIAASGPSTTAIPPRKRPQPRSGRKTVKALQALEEQKAQQDKKTERQSETRSTRSSRNHGGHEPAASSPVTPVDEDLVTRKSKTASRLTNKAVAEDSAQAKPPITIKLNVNRSRRASSVSSSELSEAPSVDERPQSQTSGSVATRPIKIPSVTTIEATQAQSSTLNRQRTMERTTSMSSQGSKKRKMVVVSDSEENDSGDEQTQPPATQPSSQSVSKPPPKKSSLPPPKMKIDLLESDQEDEPEAPQVASQQSDRPLKPATSPVSQSAPVVVAEEMVENVPKKKRKMVQFNSSAQSAQQTVDADSLDETAAHDETTPRARSSSRRASSPEPESLDAPRSKPSPVTTPGTTTVGGGTQRKRPVPKRRRSSAALSQPTSDVPVKGDATASPNPANSLVSPTREAISNTSDAHKTLSPEPESSKTHAAALLNQGDEASDPSSKTPHAQTTASSTLDPLASDSSKTPTPHLPSTQAQVSSSGSGKTPNAPSTSGKTPNATSTSGKTPNPLSTSGKISNSSKPAVPMTRKPAGRVTSGRGTPAGPGSGSGTPSNRSGMTGDKIMDLLSASLPGASPAYASALGVNGGGSSPASSVSSSRAGGPNARFKVGKTSVNYSQSQSVANTVRGTLNLMGCTRKIVDYQVSETSELFFLLASTLKACVACV